MDFELVAVWDLECLAVNIYTGWHRRTNKNLSWYGI